MKEKFKIKHWHIAILVLGSIFLSLSIFHSNLWFDESYSVGMARHSFSEIWTIGSKDVHPVLYYMCLHILYLVFGNNMIVYRLFSTLTIILLAVLGYTHIRKDFGEKVGLLFSFLVLFLPVSGMYAGEIRMYSLGMLLGTIMAIYAYRIYQGKQSKCNYILFGISSLFVSYTHYYGLMLAGIVNILLFIWLIRNRKEKKEDLKKFILTAVLQVIAYLPWLIYFITQLKSVSQGFWISLSFPGTLIELLTMPYIGNLPVGVAITFSSLLYLYIGYLVVKQKKEERKPATWCFMIYIGVILLALAISLAMHSVILLHRYLLILTGLLIFGLAYFMAKDTKTWRVFTVCTIILISSIYSNVVNIQDNYQAQNRDCVNYLMEQIQEGDIIVYSNAINGAVITTEIANQKENVSYFYNKEHWGVQEAYQAFGPSMQIKDTLEEILDTYQGTIWLVESENTTDLYEEIASQYEVQKIEERQFQVAYKDYRYTIERLQK